MNVNRSQILFAGIFIIAALICIGINLSYSSKCKDYISTEAKIVDVYKSVDSDSETVVRKFYVLYEFEFQNETIRAERQVLTRLGHKIGKTETIRFDPNDPHKLERTYILTLGRLGAVSFFILAAVFFFAMRKHK